MALKLSKGHPTKNYYTSKRKIIITLYKCNHLFIKEKSKLPNKEILPSIHSRQLFIYTHQKAVLCRLNLTEMTDMTLKKCRIKNSLRL